MTAYWAWFATDFHLAWTILGVFLFLVFGFVVVVVDDDGDWWLF